MWTPSERVRLRYRCRVADETLRRYYADPSDVRDATRRRIEDAAREEGISLPSREPELNKVGRDLDRAKYGEQSTEEDRPKLYGLFFEIGKGLDLLQAHEQGAGNAAFDALYELQGRVRDVRVRERAAPGEHQCRLCLKPCRFLVFDQDGPSWLPGYCAEHWKVLLDEPRIASAQKEKP